MLKCLTEESLRKRLFTDVLVKHRDVKYSRLKARHHNQPGLTEQGQRTVVSEHENPLKPRIEAI